MTQLGQASRHCLLASRQNIDTTPEDSVHARAAALRDVTGQLESNISTATQVGHQLAIIGDEYNRIYSGKQEETLFNLAKGIAASTFHTCAWSNFKSILKRLGSFFNNDWRKKIFDYGHWILLLPLQYMFQRWVPATLLAILMWWLVTQGLHY